MVLYSCKVKEGEQIKAYSGSVAAFGAIAAKFDAKIGSTIAAAGGVMYLIGDAQVKSFSTVKKNTKYNVKMDFKWTNTNNYPLKGTFRIKSYFTYNGKIVGKTKTYYQNRQFSPGERW